MATRLVRLSDLDEHRVAKEHSDPRGWEVLSDEGRRVGKVVELLVDPDVLRARYLDVRVDEKELDMEPVDRHILLPVDQVRLRDGKKVEVNGLTRSDFRDYPAYNGLPLQEEDERRLMSVFGDSRPRRGEEERRTVATGRRDDDDARGGEVRERVVRDPDAREREPLDRRPDAPRAGTRDPEHRAADPGTADSTRLQEGEEVRVRVRDGEIVIEKGGRVDD